MAHPADSVRPINREQLTERGKISVMVGLEESSAADFISHLLSAARGWHDLISHLSKFYFLQWGKRGGQAGKVGGSS